MTRTRAFRKHSDDGVAMLTVIMVIALLAVLTTTLAAVSISGLSSARLSQQAGAALNSANAGVSQAVTYLRTNGTFTINQCSPTCSTEPWGNKTNPKTVTIPGKLGQSYKVWIEVIEPFPQYTPGLYRIHATGSAGGPASRSVEADAYVDTYDVPMGVLSNTVVGGGDASVHRVSLFSTGCIYQRSKIKFDGIDAAYGIPAAAHSSQIITDAQGSGQYCPDTAKPIHDPNLLGGARYCNPLFPYDEDMYGGDLTGTPCKGTGTTYPQSSYIASDADMFARYRMKQPVFTQSQLDNLKAVAISQGNYYTSATGWTSPSGPHAVLYFDLAQTNPGGLVDLNDITGWGRVTGLTSTATDCVSKSLVVIIDGGNARLNSNSVLTASVFLLSGDPYGQVFKANGNSAFTGTLYANQLDLTGTADMSLDECFIANRSPALSRVETFNYREVDR